MGTTTGFNATILCESAFKGISDPAAYTTGIAPVSAAAVINRSQSFQVKMGYEGIVNIQSLR